PGVVAETMFVASSCAVPALPRRLTTAEQRPPCATAHVRESVVELFPFRHPARSVSKPVVASGWAGGALVVEGGQATGAGGGGEAAGAGGGGGAGLWVGGGGDGAGVVVVTGGGGGGGGGGAVVPATA